MTTSDHVQMLTDTPVTKYLLFHVGVMFFVRNQILVTALGI